MELESCSFCNSGSAFQPVTPLTPCLTCLLSYGLVSLLGTGIPALDTGLMLWCLLVHAVVCDCRGLGWVAVCISQVFKKVQSSSDCLAHSRQGGS